MTPGNGAGQAQLLIGLLRTEAGQLVVTGPVDDPVVAYGLLEVARQLVADHLRAKAASPIVKAAAMPPVLRG